MAKIFGLMAVMTAVVLLATGCVKQPAEVLKNMNAKMAETTTYDYNMVMSAAMSGIPGTTVDTNVTATVDGKVDMKDDKVAQSMNMKIDVSSEGMLISADGNLVATPEMLYAKLNTVPNLGLFDLSAIKGTWFKFDLAKLTQGAKAGEKVDLQKLTADQKALAKKIWENTKLITVVKDFGVEKLDNVGKAYHYQVKINKDEAEKMIKEMYVLMEKKDFTADEVIQLQTALANLDTANIEIWVGYKDYYIYKMTFAMDMNIESATAKLKLTANFANFNKPVAIEIPADAQEFNPAALMGGATVNPEPVTDLPTGESIYLTVPPTPKN